MEPTTIIITSMISVLRVIRFCTPLDPDLVVVALEYYLIRT